MKQKFNLSEFHDVKEPVIMYGMYNSDDYTFYETHEPFIIVLWRGTDSKILNADKAQRIKAKTNVRHIAGSRDVSANLKRYGIQSEMIVITPTPLDIKSKKSGECVYCYICSEDPKMSVKYRLDWLQKLERKLPYKFIYTTQKKYSRTKLIEVYKRCFVGIRLLDHDGMSNSIIEMGMMGRRTISNSSLPHTIHWKTFDDVLNAIQAEYKNRNKINNTVSIDYWNLINIGDDWRNIA